MFKLANFLCLIVIFLYALAVVSAQNSTSVRTSTDSLIDEARKRKKFPFGHHLWWWGLKALSIFVTVKIKIILLLLFIGGGVFYGLKIWQGTALGCPEPIISEIIKHGSSEGISPYHGHFDSEDISAYPGASYPGSSYPGSYAGPTSIGGVAGGYDGNSGVYSNTPAGPDPTYSGPNYLPPSYSGPTYLPPSDGSSYPNAPPSAGGVDTSQTGGSYPNRRRTRQSGRQISEESQNMFSDLIFRFLGVNTDQCRRRFICELEFRNPFMGYAMKYVGVELFKEYVPPKQGPKAPKQFTDCAKLYRECRAPNEHPVGLKMKKKFAIKSNETETEQTEAEITTEIDPVTQYVKQGKA